MWNPGKTLEQIEHETIIEALRFFHGSRVNAASSLGISQRTMTNKIQAMKDKGMKVPPAPLSGFCKPKEEPAE